MKNFLLICAVLFVKSLAAQVTFTYTGMYYSLYQSGQGVYNGFVPVGGPGDFLFKIQNNSLEEKAVIWSRTRLVHDCPYPDYYWWSNSNGDLTGLYMAPETDIDNFMGPDTFWIQPNDFYFLEILMEIDNDPSSIEHNRYYLSDTNGIILDSMDLIIGVNGIAEFDLGEYLHVSPNPCAEYLHLNLTKPLQGRLELVDIAGAILYAEEFNASTIIPVHAFNPGMYVLHIISESIGSHSLKIIIQ